MTRTSRKAKSAPLGSKEAEQALIGCLFGLPGGPDKKRAALDETRALLAGTDFTSNELRWIYAAICEMDDAGDDINFISVSAYLGKKGTWRTDEEDALAEPDGYEFPTHRTMNRCTASASTVQWDYKKYAQTVRDFAEARSMRHALFDIMERLDDGFLEARQEARRCVERWAERDTRQSGPQGFTAAELMKQTFAPTQFVVDNLITLGLTLLCGPPKSRKSWMALDTALALTLAGRALGAVPVEKTGALCLCMEDTPADLQGRLTALLQGAAPPGNLHLFTEWPGADAGGLAHLDRWLAAHSDVKFVVVDTLQIFRPQQAEKGNAYKQDVDAVRSLKTVADRHGVAMVCIHHTTKLSSDNPFSTISGTNGIFGSADNALVITEGRTKYEAVLHARGRKIRDSKTALSCDDRWPAWKAEGDADMIGISQEREAILEYLQAEGKPVQIVKMARDMGRDYNATKSLLGKMLHDGQVINENSKYRLPTDAEKRIQPLTPLTALTIYEGLGADEVVHYGENPVDKVLNETGEVMPHALDDLKTVNAVNSVNAVNAEKQLFAHLCHDLNLNLGAYRGNTLNQVRNFVVWWYSNYDKLLRQNDFEEYFPIFMSTWPAPTKNYPAWMDKMRP